MIRRGAHSDVTFMRSMLAHAYHWRVAVLDAPIPLARYTENWGRAGDVSVIAMEGGHSLGVAWLRLFPASAPGYGFVDEQTPELTISVVPSRRRHGLGQELLDALLERAREAGFAAVSLSVEAESPAVAFYERNGFVQVGESHGGLTMRLDLTEHPASETSS
jgi:GNAT superfamily N-acetyltransferase